MSKLIIKPCHHDPRGLISIATGMLHVCDLVQDILWTLRRQAGGLARAPAAPSGEPAIYLTRFGLGWYVTGEGWGEL